MIIYAVTNGFLDDVPVERVKEWENAFHEYLHNNQREFLDSLITDYARKQRRKKCSTRWTIINQFKKTCV